jgi:hypothetical protein
MILDMSIAPAPPMSNPGPERHNLRLRSLPVEFGVWRQVRYILVPVYLTGLGSAPEVGVLTTAMLLGSLMMTLTIGLIAHRLQGSHS